MEARDGGSEANAASGTESEPPKRKPGRPKGSGKKPSPKPRSEAQRTTDEHHARDKRNRELVKAMGLTDGQGRLLEPGKRKSDRQVTDEARLALQEQVMDLNAAGLPPHEIGVALDIPEGHIQPLIDQALASIARHQAAATPADHFARYSYFTFRQIRRLDRLIDQFMRDPEAKQYNATVTAERARSDLLDKIYRMGERMGVMKLGKVSGETGRKGTELVEALVTERKRLDEVIAELECSIERKTIKAKVKRAPKTMDPVETTATVVAGRADPGDEIEELRAELERERVRNKV